MYLHPRACTLLTLGGGVSLTCESVLAGFAVDSVYEVAAIFIVSIVCPSLIVMRREHFLSSMWGLTNDYVYRILLKSNVHLHFLFD